MIVKILRNIVRIVHKALLMCLREVPLSFVIAYTLNTILKSFHIKLPFCILVRIPHNVYTYYCFDKDFDYKHVVDEHPLNKRLGFQPRNFEVVIDVGANIGNFTMYAARGSKLVISIEPNRDVLRYLYTLININKLSNIIVLNCACGRVDGYVELFITQHATTHSIKFDYASRHGLVKKIVVPCYRLDNIVKYAVKKYGLRQIDLVFIDVERGELEVLAGFEESLKKKLVKKIKIEIDDIANLSEVITILRRYGYKVVYVNGSVYAWS